MVNYFKFWMNSFPRNEIKYGKWFTVCFQSFLSRRRWQTALSLQHIMATKECKEVSFRLFECKRMLHHCLISSYPLLKETCPDLGFKVPSLLSVKKTSNVQVCNAIQNDGNGVPKWLLISLEWIIRSLSNFLANRYTKHALQYILFFFEENVFFLILLYFMYSKYKVKKFVSTSVAFCLFSVIEHIS